MWVLVSFPRNSFPKKVPFNTQCSDPVATARRIVFMLTDASTLTITTARQMRGAQVASKVLARSARQDKPAKEDPVTATNRPDRMAWVTHLTAVRDTQDQKAFAELFAYFAPRVKAFLMKSGTSPDMAEEVSQEVMATLWRKAHMFDPAKASVSTWIFTIARNRRIDVLRKQRRPEPEELTWGPEAEPDQEDVLALQQESAQLGEALAALPEKQRDLIVRAYYGELTHSEIADATGLPLGTIKSRIRLALDRLRHQMK